MTTSDDYEVDRAALERMWYHGPYRDKWARNWWCRVGHTRRMREGLVAPRVGRGPRGLVVTRAGRIVTRSTVSGEIST